MSLEALDRVVAQRKATAESLSIETEATKALPQLWKDTVDLIESKTLGEINASQSGGWDTKKVNPTILYKGERIKYTLSFSTRPQDDANKRWEEIEFEIDRKRILALGSCGISHTDINPYDPNKGRRAKANPQSILDMVELVDFLKINPKGKGDVAVFKTPQR